MNFGGPSKEVPEGWEVREVEEGFVKGDGPRRALEVSISPSRRPVPFPGRQRRLLNTLISPVVIIIITSGDGE